MNTGLQLNTAFQDARPNTDYRGPILSNAAFTNYRVRVPQLQSAWMQILQVRFDELSSLPQGWDGYRGSPVSFTCASFAAAMLERLCQENVSAPSLVPGSDGTLQIEWHENLYDIEIDVLSPQNIVATRYDHVTDKVVVLELESDFTQIGGWISDLSVDRKILDQEIA